MRERDRLDKAVGAVRRLEGETANNVEMIELADAEGDQSLVSEAEAAIRALRDEADHMRLESLLSGEADANNCYIEINAGQGGTEAQDWAEMLARMYMRWAEQHGYKVTYLEESPGEGAGIKSCAMKVDGPNAYGWLKTESGVHRLVRISPYDSAARRHTSFASVWVYPEVDDDIEIEIVDKDIRVDTYRASGAGGQHVNKTDSAVRITHRPSGIVVQCQNERSQSSNKATAMAMLRAKLLEAEERRRADELAREKGEAQDVGWGSQIRSYVLHPYSMVKDHRTDYEVGDTTRVLDGDLDGFVRAELHRRAAA